MTLEELEEDVHAALDQATWVTVQIRGKRGGEWNFTINGVHFKQPTRALAFRFLSLFFLKASSLEAEGKLTRD